jgi:hypothetical protein
MKRKRKKSRAPWISSADSSTWLLRSSTYLRRGLTGLAPVAAPLRLELARSLPYPPWLELRRGPSASLPPDGGQVANVALRIRRAHPQRVTSAAAASSSASEEPPPKEVRKRGRGSVKKERKNMLDCGAHSPCAAGSESIAWMENHGHMQTQHCAGKCSPCPLGRGRS